MLDRNYQRALLEKMQEAYPDMIDTRSEQSEKRQNFYFNIAYLMEHGLCDANILRSNGIVGAVAGAKITAKGIDFLADDGGLSAILGVVTVKLHPDTIVSLVNARIDALSAPDEKKSMLRRAVANLSNKALEKGSSELLLLGIQKIPDIVQWLEHISGI